MTEKSDFSWLPEELRSDITQDRGNRLAQILGEQTYRYPRSILTSKYCLRLLANDPRAIGIWNDIQHLGVSPLDVYWACELPFEQSEKYKTKKMSASKVDQLEQEIKKTAKQLRRLVEKTPVDEVFTLANFMTNEGKVQFSFSEFLEIIETTDFSDYVDGDEYLRPVKNPGAKKSIRTEIILSLREVLSGVRPNKRNRLIADIVSYVIGEVVSEETIKDVIKKQKKPV